MKILFGGAFNPPTIGHLQIIEYLIEKFPDSEITVMPTNDSYNKKGLIDFLDRLKMVELMCEGLKNVKVSDYEYTLTEYLGTYYTLKHFEGYYFVIGADSLATIDKWINFEKLISENKFLVIPREGYDVKEIIDNDSLLSANCDNFIFLSDFNPVDVSSTLYRKTNDCKLVIDKVDEYIKKHGFYQGG